jgi:MoxR-like ATPase
MATMTYRDVQQSLADTGYVASDALAMALHLALTLQRPLLLEGEAGVGKTAIAQALADSLGARLIRLQCYEGLDAAQAIYEWNYQRQLLAIRAHEGEDADQVEERLFSEKYLLRRPLLEAISQIEPPVLLIDEVDRADEEFEAYLLEVLSDFQITVPELGTITATSRPHVILTSNGTRELSDALRRRCLYNYVEYPDRATELAILNHRQPGLEARLAAQIVGVVQALRKEELEKKPGVAETLDWAAALSGLGVHDLADDPVAVQATLVCLLKTRADQATIPPEVSARLIGAAA